MHTDLEKKRFWKMDMQEVGLPSGWDARLGLNGRIFYYRYVEINI